MSLSASNRVLYIACFAAEENLDLLLLACRKASVGISFVGEGLMKEHIKEMALRIGVDAKFYNVVPNNKLPAIINSHRIVVLVSMFGGNPKVLLGAMACSRAIIGSRVDGIQDIITHNETGILCELSEHSIAKAILLLKDNPEYALKVGEKAKERMQF